MTPEAPSNGVLAWVASIVATCVAAVFTAILGYVGFEHRRKTTQIDKHLELVDSRLGELEQHSISRAEMNAAFENNLGHINRQFDDLKRGHADINASIRQLVDRL